MTNHVTTNRMRFSASLMCSNFRSLESEIAALEKAGVDEFHVDVMDGHFVPNIALGPDIAKAVAQMTDRPVEVHLMVDEPERILHVFAGGRIKRVTVHVEATANLKRLFDTAHGLFEEVFVAINPFTPISSLEYAVRAADGVLVMTVEPGFAGQEFFPFSGEKIASLRSMLSRLGIERDIEVDGAIGPRSIGEVFAAGANIAVLGTSGLYRPNETFESALGKLRDILSHVQAVKHSGMATPEVAS